MAACSPRSASVIRMDLIFAGVLSGRQLDSSQPGASVPDRIRIRVAAPESTTKALGGNEEGARATGVVDDKISRPGVSQNEKRGQQLRFLGWVRPDRIVVV